MTEPRIGLLDDLRAGIDAAEREISTLRDENRELRRLLVRILAVVGKGDRLIADREQLRIARARIQPSDLRSSDGDRCHYCDVTEGEFHRDDCPVPSFEDGENP